MSSSNNQQKPNTNNNNKKQQQQKEGGSGGGAKKSFNKNKNNNKNHNAKSNNNMKEGNNNKALQQHGGAASLSSAAADPKSLSSILQKPKAHFNNNNNKNEDAAENQTDNNNNNNQKQNQQIQNQHDQSPPAFSRQLDLVNAPRMTYKNSKQRPNVLKGLHLGQRKLLLSEIEFLSLALDEKENPLEIQKDEATNNSSSSYHLMIYAGAAPGGHTPFLSRELFPDNVAFLLIDPAPFDENLCEISKHVIVGENAQDTPGLAQKTKSDLVSKDFNLSAVLPSKAGEITILRDYCTAELCSKIRIALSQLGRGNNNNEGKPPRSVLFVSDIRVGDMNRKCTNAEATEIIMQDNELQKQCCEALQPEAAMLKFRPPFPKDGNPKSPYYDKDDHTPDEINYYQGKVFFGVWAPKSSTETRLVVSNFGAKNAGQKYNCKSFEEQLCYYNLSDRYQSDVRAEEDILKKYSKIAHLCNKKKFSSSSSSSSPKLLSKEISKHLGHGSDLFQPLETETFSESDARLWVLLFIGCHLAGAGDHPLERKKNQQQISNETMDKAVNIFEKLRKEVSIEKIVSGNTESEVMKTFWKEYSSAMRLGESYCFLPWIHAKLVPRFHQPTTTTSGGNNNNNNNSRGERNSTKNNNNKQNHHHDQQRRPRTGEDGSHNKKSFGSAPQSHENTKTKFDDDDE